MCKHQVVKFQGEEYIFVGDSIATVEQYEAGALSFACLTPDGRIMQFGKQIGTKDDLTFTKKTRKANITLKSLGGLMFDESWPSNPGWPGEEDEYDEEETPCDKS